MNFADVKELTIPEGAVLRIRKGDVVLWTKHTGLLPAEYQQVEYIQTDGNQYIDTGVLASDHPEGITYTWYGRQTGVASGNNYYFGAMSSTCRSGNLGYNNAGNYRVILASGNSMRHMHGISATGYDRKIVITSLTSANPNISTATVDGEAFATNNALAALPMPEVSIHIFNVNGLSTAKRYQGRLYLFTMDKPDGTPIRNYVPCYRKSDSKPGVYDTVEGKFYANAGTGSFTVGPDV